MGLILWGNILETIGILFITLIIMIPSLTIMDNYFKRKEKSKN